MCNEKNKLIIDLTRIKENDFKLAEGEKATDYLDLMLKYIGDPDPVLRDDLILETFCNFISNKAYFPNDVTIALLDTLLSKDYLFYNIGSEGDDSVLKRSFSSLVIDCISWNNLDNNFLDKATVLKTFDLIIKYFNEEQDLRGFDNKKGWMHALAHTSDNFHSLLNQPKIVEDAELCEDCCKKILSSIENKLLEGKDLFAADEDERMLTPIFWDMLADKLVPYDYICNWIEGLGRVMDIKDKYTKSKAKINVKHFARSFYFRVFYLKDIPEFENKEAIPALSEAIINLEKRVNYYSHI